MSTSTTEKVGPTPQTGAEPTEETAPGLEGAEESDRSLLDPATSRPSLVHQARELLYVLLSQVRRQRVGVMVLSGLGFLLVASLLGRMLRKRS
jgi:hypothetical protein